MRPEALAVRLEGRNIHDICCSSIQAAMDWFSTLTVQPDRVAVATPIVTEMLHRLRFLVKVGVGYLTLGRGAGSLSGGELQRVRLATSIGSGLVGVCYILDEPSIGLHQRDNDRLIDSLRDLQRQGNTVIVVEHDESMMRAADYLVDVGPGAGDRGGEILCSGSPLAVEKTATPSRRSTCVPTSKWCVKPHVESRSMLGFSCKGLVAQFEERGCLSPAGHAGGGDGR